MPDQFILILAVIATLSIFQSVFGIGILVFGTPTLLLLGFEFATALSFLLPASLAISLLQVISFPGQRPAISPYLYLLCIPGIALGLLFTESMSSTVWPHYLVGAILLISAIIRLDQRVQGWLTNALGKNIAFYHAVMGTVHGLTNLGGAFLAVFASTTSTDKQTIRYRIAYYYLLFSVVQIFVLVMIAGFQKMLSLNLLMALVSTSVYLLVGNRIFIRSNNGRYQIALSGFMAACGIAILLNA